MFVYTAVGTGVILLAGIVGGRIVLAADPVTWDGKIVQYGKMHEAIGAQKHEGRVKLAKLLQQRHFFGVAAMEGLKGEATIVDGKVTVTRGSSPPRLMARQPCWSVLMYRRGENTK